MLSKGYSMEEQFWYLIMIVSFSFCVDIVAALAYSKLGDLIVLVYLCWSKAYRKKMYMFHAKKKKTWLFIIVKYVFETWSQQWENVKYNTQTVFAFFTNLIIYSWTLNAIGIKKQSTRTPLSIEHTEIRHCLHFSVPRLQHAGGTTLTSDTKSVAKS